MTRGEAIRELRNIRDSMPSDTCFDWIEAINIAITNMFMIPKLMDELKSTWVPCSERLPEEDGYYLVTLGNDNPEEGRDVELVSWQQVGESTDGWDWWLQEEVRAWRELPEPYMG